MKVLNSNEEGSKILLEPKDALIAFTPKGIQFSFPKEYGELIAKIRREQGGHPTKEDTKKLIDWIDTNNPYFETFVKIKGDILEDPDMDQNFHEN